MIHFHVYALVHVDWLFTNHCLQSNLVVQHASIVTQELPFQTLPLGQLAEQFCDTQSNVHLYE